MWLQLFASSARNYGTGNNAILISFVEGMIQCYAEMGLVAVRKYSCRTWY